MISQPYAGNLFFYPLLTTYCHIFAYFMLVTHGSIATYVDVPFFFLSVQLKVQCLGTKSKLR